jgi:hypothetical protein
MRKGVQFMRRDNENRFRTPNPSVFAVVLISCLMTPQMPGFAQRPKATGRNADGKLMYIYDDTRYGSQGVRAEIFDDDGRLRLRIWKDSKGRVLEEEKTIYGIAEQKTVDTTVYNPTSDGGRQLATLKTIKTNSRGEEIYNEVKIFDKSEKRIGGTRTEVGPKGEKRTFRWDPEKKDYVEETPGATSSTTPVKTSASSGFSVASDVVSGLNMTTFDTPRGKIYVNLPDDVSAGDTLSGTVVAEPEGQDDKTRTRNQGELAGYVVQLEHQQSSSADRLLKLSVPAAINTTYLILKDKNGKEVARCEVPVEKQQFTTPQEFGLPMIGQQGRSVEVTGNFDGDSRTTNLMLGTEELQILAESPRKLVARNTSTKVGLNQLVVREQGRTAVGQFRSIGLSLSAPKLDLLKGEQTTLTVTVFGLEGIKAPVPLILENRSPGIIQMGSANMERISISPPQVRGGTYTTQRPLTGIQRGAFTIVGTVTRDEQ